LNKQVKFLVHGGYAALDFGDLYFEAIYFYYYLLILKVLPGDFSFTISDSPLGNSPSASHGDQESG